MTGSEKFTSVASTVSSIVTAYNSSGPEMLIANITPHLGKIAAEQVIQTAGVQNEEIRDGIEILVHEIARKTMNNLQGQVAKEDVLPKLGKRKLTDEDPLFEQIRKKPKTSELESVDRSVLAAINGVTRIF